MFAVFLDESGDHNLKTIDSTYPIFCLAACIFDFDYYHSKVEKKLDKIKIKHFGTTDPIVRSYDIRKQRKQFKSLVDLRKRTSFYQDLDKFIKTLDFKIIAAVINKSKLKSNYRTPDDPYDLCFQFIMERLCMYIGRSGQKAIMRIESRETHNDKILAEDYENFRKTGNQLIKPDEVKEKLTDLSFNQKSQNIVGHQIADLVAYPIGIHVFHPTRDNPAFEIIKKKIHTKSNTNIYLNYGLKVFP